MIKELMPYYISRLLFAILFGLLTYFSMNNIWFSLLICLLMFSGFIWYAHNGRYIIDTSKPLTPLRRDDRGKSIRDRSLVMAVLLSSFSYLIFTLINFIYPIYFNFGYFSILIGIIAYFVVSNLIYRQ